MAMWRFVTGGALISTLVLTTGTAVAADEQKQELEQEQRSKPKHHTSSYEILAHMDEANERPSWYEPQLEFFHLSKKTGLVYKRRFDRGDRGLILTVRGPFWKMRKGKPGIRIELEF